MRYSQAPLPTYRYLPGRGPHPEENQHRVALGFDETYRYGVDLFNHGYFWECHEAWESLWLPNKKDPLSGLFFQGLILVAAAMLKLWMGQASSFDKLNLTALAKLNLIKTNPVFGLDLISWKKQVSDFSKTSQKILNQDPLLAKEFPYIILSSYDHQTNQR